MFYTRMLIPPSKRRHKEGKGYGIKCENNLYIHGIVGLNIRLRNSAPHFALSEGEITIIYTVTLICISRDIQNGTKNKHHFLTSCMIRKVSTHIKVDRGNLGTKC